MPSQLIRPCAFRICHLQMVRSSTLSIPYDKKCLLPRKQTRTKSQKAFLTGTELSPEVSPQVLSRFPGLQICIFSFPSHTKSCTMDSLGNIPCLQWPDRLGLAPNSLFLPKFWIWQALNTLYGIVLFYYSIDLVIRQGTLSAICYELYNSHQQWMEIVQNWYRCEL